MRPKTALDAEDPRCRFPVFAKQFNDAMERTGFSVAEIAIKLGIRQENIYNYRRGFMRASPGTAEVMAEVFGETFDMSENSKSPRSEIEQLRARVAELEIALLKAQIEVLQLKAGDDNAQA